jgi:hypothetical protein
MIAPSIAGVSWEDTCAGWTPETLRRYKSEKWKRSFELKREHENLLKLSNLYRMEIANSMTEKLDLSSIVQHRDLFAEELGDCQPANLP